MADGSPLVAWYSSVLDRRERDAETIHHLGCASIRAELDFFGQPCFSGDACDCGTPQVETRRVALDRRLLDAHQPRPLVDPDGRERPDWPERECRICHHSWMGTPDWYCEVLRQLAEMHDQEPGYDERWRP